MKVIATLFLAFGCTATAWGQAAAEAGVATGASSGAATGARGAGQAVGGVFGALGRTLSGAVPSSSSSSSGAKQTIVINRSRYTPVPAPESKPVDAAKVVVGMPLADLLEMGGEPTTRLSQSQGGHYVETLWYATVDDDELRVEIIDGKVAATELASERVRAAAARRR